MKTIKIIIDPTGKSSIDLVGFHGEGCLDVVRSFGEGDGQLTEVTPKAEFYEQSESEREREVV